MLQHAVALLLQRLLGKFVSFDSRMLRLSLWQGDVSFKDLQLRLSYGEGSIGELNVKIPWRALWTQPVVIKAQGLRILMHQSPKTAATEIERQFLSQDGDTAADTSTDENGDGPTDRTYLSRLVTHIISNVQIELSDVQIRYDCMTLSATKCSSALLEITSMNLINTNANWELEFTPQSTSIMESRKLLKTDGISVYVEIDTHQHERPTSIRHYLLHEWASEIKATLSYNSSNSSFPDVELDIDLGTKPMPDATAACSYCAFANTSHHLSDLTNDSPEQPRVHLSADHVDVFHAILMEVKAPYEEYERLSELTSLQASRPEGFVMVLSYARQWLLSDCLDGISSEVVASASNSDDEDDDDEFEDAITPPTLTIRASLSSGLGFVVLSRGSHMDDPSAQHFTWTCSVGPSSACVKQSCIEDEIEVDIGWLVLNEMERGNSRGYSIFEHRKPSTQMDPTSPFISFSCVIPAYESRLVGHQPVITLAISHDIVLALKDQTVMMWMTLLAPVYEWWNSWNIAHPSKILRVDNNRIAPISVMTVELKSLSLFFEVRTELCFGVIIDRIEVATRDDDPACVISDFFLGDVTLFSACAKLRDVLTNAVTSRIPSTYHQLFAFGGGRLSKTSHSRSNWENELYACCHDKSTTAMHGADETPMYKYDVVLPSLNVNLQIQELEALSWVIGKWSYFMPDHAADDRVSIEEMDVCQNERKCFNKWSISAPEVVFKLLDDPQCSDQQELAISVHKFNFTSTRCSVSQEQRVSIGALSMQDGEQTLLSAQSSSESSNGASSITLRRSVWCGDDFETVVGMNMMLDKLNIHCNLNSISRICKWVNNCARVAEVGFIVSSSLGYDFNSFRRNLECVASRRAKLRAKGASNKYRFHFSVARSCRMVVVHSIVCEGYVSSRLPVEIGAVECGDLGIVIATEGSASERGNWTVKGTIRNLHVIDLTVPTELPNSAAEMVNRSFISSNQLAADGSLDKNMCNSADFSMTVSSTWKISASVRLDSFNVAYLHRVYKQFHHYVTDHVMSTLRLLQVHGQEPSDKVQHILSVYEVTVGMLPVSMDEVLSTYYGVVEPSAREQSLPWDPTMIELQLILNDFVFSLPRSSFSQESIILRCTNARLWSSNLDVESSDFLQTGNLEHDRRGSHLLLSDTSNTKARQTRRLELRNLRRSVKNQRSRVLSNRSQLFVDLRNATQQAQNYLHEGFEALPAAEEAVRILRTKIITLEKQLDQLDKYLTEVDAAIDVVLGDTDSIDSNRDSLHMMLASPAVNDNGSVVATAMIQRIRDDIMGMSQHLIAPLFVADDAEFHDARTLAERASADGNDMSTSVMPLFEFELIDMSGSTSNSSSPLFHHALLTGRMESLPECLPDDILSSFLNIDLGVNELSVGVHPEQYSTFLGIIFENFKEVSSAVDEDTYPYCDTCDGHHYDSYPCRAIWLKIPIKIVDAALRVSSRDHPIGDLMLEQLELTFTLRTDDSLEIGASSVSVTAIDVRPGRCESAVELLRPLGGDGIQVEYNQVLNWTDSQYRLSLNKANFLVVVPAITELVQFFVAPVLDAGAYYQFGTGYMGSAPPDWKKMDFRIESHDCSFALLEDFSKVDSRALVILSSIEIGYSSCQKCEDMIDMKKCHFSFDQRGVFFSQLPDLQIDVSFPLANSFLLIFDHLIEGISKLNRRNSFVLAPVEARFSVQDGILFLNILNNYMKSVAKSLEGDKSANLTSESLDLTVDTLFSDDSQVSRDRKISVSTHSASAMPSPTPVYAMDKLLGDVGELRFVLVNNSLGIPIADFRISEIVCEYIQDEECSVVVGAIFALNYFNNSIYRWEPLVEPFVVQVRSQRLLDYQGRAEMLINVPNTVNLNLTPAMAPLLSSNAFNQADFVTTGSKSTAPFWIVNRTGADLKFSFRRGVGSVIQQVVPNEVKVAVDCREQGDMRSFDSASSDRFLRPSDSQALTVNHTLSVWLNDSKWVSANPVVVDVVGHISVPLREVTASHVDDADGQEDDSSPPILVAEITIQPDGSKLISLHSQVVLQNRTSIPLMVWAFSPRNGGSIREWIVDREQICHVPIQLIHPHSKISVKPSPYVQYAPLATSLEELGDEVRAVKSTNTKRFVRSGQCICNFETFSSSDDLKNAQRMMAAMTRSETAAPLSGYVVQDLPTWKCTYDVEAYFLMRATFSSADEVKPNTVTSNTDLPVVSEEESNDKVEEEFLNVFSERHPNRRINNALTEVNHELEEARAANQRRGLYEATNSSLYYLSVSPFVTLHNRLATAVAYRLLNESLQLIGEGILAVGSILPLFQVDQTTSLFLSFRMENYNWSSPKMVMNAKNPSYSLPYKERVEPIDLAGRVFNRDVIGEQGNVPNLQLQVKLLGRDIMVFCSVWIVNHSGLDLEYCSSTSSSSRRLDSVLRYVHKCSSHDVDQSALFSTRTMSFHGGDLSRGVELMRLQKVKAQSNPVALIVVVQDAKNLYNAQYFGAQSPYVRVSLYVLKNPQDRFVERPEMQVFCSGTSKPSPSGGVNPKWDTKLQNTILLRLPSDMRYLEKARVIIEVRNVRYGMDTCLGVTAIKLETILNSREHSAGFNWYKLLKRKAAKGSASKTTTQSNVHRGDLRMSFTVGTKQELQSELDAGLLDTPDSQRSPSFLDDERPSFTSPTGREGVDTGTFDGCTGLDSHTSDFLPTSGAISAMQRMQTPSQMGLLPMSTGNVHVHGSGPLSQRSGNMYPLVDDPTISQAHGLVTDASSTRNTVGTRVSNGASVSPAKTLMRGGGGNLHQIQVYLPQNRFAFVVIEVMSNWLMSEIFDLICAKCGFEGVYDAEDFDFYELLLPRFISLRSAGRPEGERWYGSRIAMDVKLERRGRQFGLHLCHKLTMSTIRLYDEKSTASAHHVTPRSLRTTSQRSNPAQNRPVAWEEVLPYGAGGKNWDVLRIRSPASPWSDVIKLNRNAMGNAGVAQVITLANEVYSHDESSELRIGNLEVALWGAYGIGRFSDTIVATVVPRYILINRTSDTIKYRQLNVPQTFQLSPDELVPFHWPSASRDKLLEVTLLHRYTWSGSFRIFSLGTTYLKLRDSDDASRIYILQCQIEMVGGSIALIFRAESKRFPPYRIDNMTSFRIQYKQSNWGSATNYDELPPRTSCAYSWDVLSGHEKHISASSQDPSFPNHSSSSSRTLEIRFMRVTTSTGRLDSGKDAVETREYHLDEMATHRRIQLQRSLPSQLFTNPDHKGHLLRKDNMLKWNKKYFRLYEHMLYYFASEEDEELLGVIDLRSASDVPGAGGVAIVEKTVDTTNKGGFVSLNGFVSTISGTIFGTSSKQSVKADARNGEQDAGNIDRHSTLLRLIVNLTASSILREVSDEFAEKLAECEDKKKIGLARKGFFVNGHDLVNFLVREKHVANEHEGRTTADELLQIKIIQAVLNPHEDVSEDTADSFQHSSSVWYCVNSVNFPEDSDSMESTDDIAQLPPSKSTVLARESNSRTTQFSIVTTTKCYELKAKTPEDAREWIKRLRNAARPLQNLEDSSNLEDVTDRSVMTRSQKDIPSVIQNAKTYVHVRIRADGPTKVLELYEGGEEEGDERETKTEMSSIASVSSGSPTASEASTNAFDSLTNGASVHVRIDGFGISCVNEVPAELVYIYLGGINVHYSRMNSKMRLMVTLDDVQVDNQSPEATFTKLLCPRMEGGDLDTGDASGTRSSDGNDNPLDDPDELMRDGSSRVSGLVANPKLFRCADCKYRQANIASVHFCCAWSNEQGSTDYFEHCSFWMYPIIMQLDEDLVVASRSFLTAMSQSFGKQQTQNRGGEIRMKTVPIEIMTEALSEFKENTSTEDLDPLHSLATTTTTSSAEVRKVYFALLHIHPIELDITYRSDVFQATTRIRLHDTAKTFKSSHNRAADHLSLKRTASAPVQSSGLVLFDSDGGHTITPEDGDKSDAAWTIPSLAMHVPDLDNAPVRLNALMIEHAFGTSGDLTRRVSKYYTRQLWKQLHKILGSFDFLGNPVGFLDHLGTGVRDFVYEPLDGLRVGGKGFSKGLAKGTASLVTNTLDGTFDAASKISGTFGQGLANLSLDDHYQHVRARARRHHVRGIREGLVQGSKELSLGVYEGVTGLVLGPMRGAQQNGALGFVRGTFTGIIGLPVKPVAGIFDFASRASQGVRNRSRKYGKSNQRVRRPRVFGRYNELKCYKEADAVAYDLLKKTSGGKLAGDKIVFYNEIMQSVAAAELTKEARNRRRNDTTRERTNSLRKSLQETGNHQRQASSEGRRKLIYNVTFYQKTLGLELETDFYCENVTIKAFDESARRRAAFETTLTDSQDTLQEGDVLLRIGGVDVRGIGFHETLAMLRGTSRPITLQFESVDDIFDAPNAEPISTGSMPLSVDENAAGKLKVQLNHWIIVTEERALYMNVGSFSNPVVEWMTPLRYIYRVEWVRGVKICLHLSVGVDSLPTGPRMRPTLKALDGQERDMSVFLDVMWLSFGSPTAEEQELWPSDTSLNGYLLKKGGFSTVKRWFVLSRNCLYYFSSRKELRGIIPLGNVRLQTDVSDSYLIRITHTSAQEPLVTLQMDNGQVIERAQTEIVLIAPTEQDFEMWQSSLAHAAGRGLRHSRGTRFFVPTDASRLEMGCRDTPDFIVAPLVEALRRAVEVFNTKLITAG